VSIYIARSQEFSSALNTSEYNELEDEMLLVVLFVCADVYVVTGDECM